MRKLTFFVLITIFMNARAFAQESKIGQSFVTKTSIPVYPYSVETQKPDKSIHFLINDGIKFYVYKVLDSGYVISVWDFSPTAADKSDKVQFYQDLTSLKTDNTYPFVGKNDYYKMTKRQVGLEADKPADSSSPFAKYAALGYIDYWANNMLFFMPLKDFSENCQSIYASGNSFTWGFLALPIKARFGGNNAKFTFEENINFGLSFGWKWQQASKTYSAHNALIGVSVGNVKIDLPENKTGSSSALSFSSGYMYQYDIFQVGGFIGLDLVGNSQRDQFKYHGKPWLGIAVGVNLFGEKQTSGSKKQTQD
jgi:hypothetical protein